VSAEPDLDVPRLARKAVGKSPADISNLVKEAALIATRGKQEKVNYDHISEAFERVDLGLKRTTKVSQNDRTVTAFHEAGHLMVLYLLHPTDDVFKASIIPRGHAGGVVYHLPGEDTSHNNKHRVIANIKVALAGYVAEKVKFGVTASGVCSDFTNAMWWAHKMVWEWGMGKNEYVGDYAHIPPEQISEDIKTKLNMETTEIMQGCLKEVEEFLKREMVIFERFGKELLDRNELDFDDIEAIFKEYGKSNPRVAAKYVPKP
jgi:cell division protease FtsH